MGLENSIGPARRLRPTSHTYAVHKLLQHGGNLNAALDEHYREEDLHSRRTYTLADDLINPNVSNDLVGHTTTPIDPVEMRYDTFERRGLSVPLIKTLRRHGFDNLEEELKAIRIEQEQKAAKFFEEYTKTLSFEEKKKAAKVFGYEPVERPGQTPRVLPNNTLHRSIDGFEEQMNPLKFKEKEQASKSFGYEPVERRGQTPRVFPNNTLHHGIDDLEDKRKEGQGDLAEHRQSHLQDRYLAHATSWSSKMAEKEKKLRDKASGIEKKFQDKASRIGKSRSGVYEAPNVEQRQMNSSSQSVGARNTSYQNKPGDEERKSRGVPTWPMIGEIPESRYRSGSLAPHTPSPSVEAQRLIREKQDEEYYISLQADREKEVRQAKARNDARREMEEIEELEKQLAKKKASLPPEAAIDEENAVTIHIILPGGNRLSHRFMKYQNLQTVFDFIDGRRLAKPNTYRLVKLYIPKTEIWCRTKLLDIARTWPHKQKRDLVLGDDLISF